MIQRTPKTLCVNPQQLQRQRERRLSPKPGGQDMQKGYLTIALCLRS
jgi:hypothetical protein